ncbi:MAG: hypothetical protein TU36_004335 [Vulcanisaeta sp. AZ3]|jgi:hypothetical protein|nr:MAG: hypothetical protein TU36_00540 [Vulcanisaeta sp. AZ3]
MREGTVRASVVGKLGRLRIYIYLVLLLLYLAAYFLGYAVKPGPQFASQVNQQLEQANSEINKLSSISQIAVFSYKLTSLMATLGPSLIPVFGIWNTAENWVYSGIATNAVSSMYATSIMAQTILLSIILAIPSADGLLMILLLANSLSNREFKYYTVLSLRWYIMSVILSIVFLILITALP